MASDYGTYGPFELTREAGSVTRAALTQFWGRVAEESGREDLEDGIGVYIFATKTSKGLLKPWYVGLTASKFRKRFYEHGHNHSKSPFVKLAKFVSKGNLYVFLVPRMTSKTKLMKSTVGGKKRKTKVKSITEVEFMLIGRCLAVNKNLLNISEKAFQSGLIVPGLINDEVNSRNNAAAQFAAMMQRS